jgi:hypothetical protein
MNMEGVGYAKLRTKMVLEMEVLGKVQWQMKCNYRPKKNKNKLG